MPHIDEVLKERKNTHGDFTDHAYIAQSLKRIAYEGDKAHALSDVQKEALDMILHKIARIVSGNPNHIDHWTDIIGYSKLVEDRLTQNDTQ